MAIVRGTAVADQVKKRIGNIVFRQTKDGTIAAQRPASMTNPRTLAQMSQRIRLASLVTFYRASRYWIRKGWELKDRKESDYNAFVKANLASNPVALTKAEASNGACVVYPYRISKGSLAPIQMTENGDNMLSNIYIGDGGNIMGSGSYINPNATIGELSALILANNLTPKAGDQLSILSYQQSVDADGTPYVTVAQYEIILDVTDGRLIGNYWPVQGNDVLVVAAGDASMLSLGIVKASAAGFAMVLSRTEGGQTRVSTQSLIVPDSANYSYYTTAQHVSEAAASYGQNTEVFLDSNGIETPSYNPEIQRAVLGFYIGDLYYPAGTITPDGTGANTEVRIRTLNPASLGSSYPVRIDFEDGTSKSFTAEQAVLSGNLVTLTITQAIASSITLIRVLWSDGIITDAHFAGGIE